MFDQLTWVTALEDFTDYVIVRIFCIKKKDWLLMTLKLDTVISLVHLIMHELTALIRL
jgi:hypothetical protein